MEIPLEFFMNLVSAQFLNRFHVPFLPE